MPINVICPGCHTRFKVGDQHAGKTGACPKCKAPIEIPKPEDEVVIHAPEAEPGAVDSKGRSVLKPIRRKEAKFSVKVLAITLGMAVFSLAVAWMLRGNELSSSRWVLAVGAILLGPPLAFAGYSFLRDDERGAFRGNDVLIRSLVCGLVYALLWGVYLYVGLQLFGAETMREGMEPLWVACLTGAVAAIGTGAAFVCFDLDPGSGFFHYLLYLLVTVVLRAVMGLAVLPGLHLGG